ncbi:MAG: hypothetical protein FJX46_07970 [Alphaproteobacteria bacterium]|nr:hypothetical protein [Alphaproteobacteria bacterium]
MIPQILRWAAIGYVVIAAASKSYYWFLPNTPIGVALELAMAAAALAFARWPWAMAPAALAYGLASAQFYGPDPNGTWRAEGLKSYLYAPRQCGLGIRFPASPRAGAGEVLGQRGEIALYADLPSRTALRAECLRVNAPEAELAALSARMLDEWARRAKLEISHREQVARGDVTVMTLVGESHGLSAENEKTVNRVELRLTLIGRGLMLAIAMAPGDAPWPEMAERFLTSVTAR